ncbi:MAG TPA: ribonuclease J [Rhodospirillaceae bacterium]|nr:ribonuclease J [Rhodospirillaceae bacterium]
MVAYDDREAGIYWQSRMGNNADGIGGNSHCYEVVTAGREGGLDRARLLVDLGVKLGTCRSGYACEFSSPQGLLARREDGLVEGGGIAPQALLLTHSHEDHLGAIPHAIDMGYVVPPIHCTAFTACKVDQSLRHAGIPLDHWPQVSVVKAGEVVKLAGAEVEFVPVDHMPGASALRIATPEATVFHTGDYKFDSTLFLGDRANPGRLREIGMAGVDMVVSDSTAVAQAGEKLSEREICRNLARIIADNEGRAVVAGVLGTQLDRVVSLGRAASANGRSLVVSGASLAENLRALQLSGTDVEKVIGSRLLTPREAQALPADKVLVVTTGAFAQPNSGLMRAADRLPGALAIDPDTTVIIPQRAIPPIKGPHGAMVAKLEALGANVVTAERAPELGYGPIHQTGHAMEGDARLLYTLLRPRQMVAPIHGNGSQLNANARIAKDLGVPTLTMEQNGAVVQVTRHGARIVDYQDSRRIGAAETGATKKLPRAANGEGRRNHPPPAIYRYDLLDAGGRTVLARNIDAVRSGEAARPEKPGLLAAWRFGSRGRDTH